MTSIVNLFNDKKSKRSNEDAGDKEEIKKSRSTLKRIFGKKDKDKDKNKQVETTDQISASQNEQQFISEEDSINTEDYESGNSSSSINNNNNNTTHHQRINGSKSTSFSSLRSSSTRSIDYNHNGNNIRSDSFYSQTSDTSDISSVTTTNTNTNNTTTTTNTTTNKSTKEPKPPKSSKLKHIYNSLKFKSLKTEKSSSSNSNSNNNNRTITSSNFEFIIPNSPLPIFDQQSPPIHFYNGNTSSDFQYFGIPLSLLIKRQDNGLSIPILLEKSISFLEGHCHIEDLFFKKFNNEKVRLMKSSFEKTGDFNFYYPDPQDPHDVAQLLVEFTASLPDQLLNIELYTAIKNHTSALNSQYGGYWDIQYLAQKLTVESREYLQRLLFFLKKHVTTCLSNKPPPQTETATLTIEPPPVTTTTTTTIVDGESTETVVIAPTPTPVKIKLLVDKLSELFTPLFVNYKTHSTLYKATSTLINCCEDMFVDIDERPMTLAGEFIMMQIKNVIIPPNNLKLNNITTTSSSSKEKEKEKDKDKESSFGNTVYDVSFWESGTLFITNYRVIWKKDESITSHDSSILIPEDISITNNKTSSDNNNNNKNSDNRFEIKLYQFEIILSSIIKWEAFGKSSKSTTTTIRSQFQIFLCYCKNIRFQYLGFSDEMNFKDLEKLNLILAYYINPITDFGRFFSSVNNEIPRALLNNSTNNTSSTNLINSVGFNNDGNNVNIWDIYSPLIEGQRLKLDLDRDWRVVEFYSRDTSTIYPKRILLPNLIGDELLQSYVRKTQSKIPIFSWSNINNKSMLFRICVYNQPINNNKNFHTTGGSLSYVNNSNSSNNNVITSSNSTSSNSLNNSNNNINNNNNNSSSTTHNNILSSSGSILNNNNNYNSLLNCEEPQSPIKKRQQTQQQQIINESNKKDISSPLSGLRSSKGVLKSSKKDIKLSSSTNSTISTTPTVTDTVDVKLYHLFVNKELEFNQQQQQQQSSGTSPTSGTSSPSSSPNNLLFNKEIQMHLSSSNNSINKVKRQNEATIVFTNKVNDMNLISVYEQFKLNSSNIIFLSIPTREQVEICWFELYHSITSFDGSMDAWKSIEESKWVGSVKLLLEGCVKVSNLLDEGSSVLLKPSIDSPSHTLDLASTSSLTMLLSDPFYRTLDGFLILIEKEWIQYGFPFNNINQHKEFTLNSSTSSTTSSSSNSNNNISSSSNNNSNSSNNGNNNASMPGSGISISISKTGSISGSSSKLGGIGSISKGSSLSLINDLDKFDSSNIVMPDTIHTESLPSKKKTFLFSDSYESSILINRSFSPIFVQFLDSVWQLQRQFPFHFEFNESLLLFLVKESFSGRFGNFLYSEALRDSERKFLKRSPSIWAYINQNKSDFINLLYKHTGGSSVTTNKAPSPVSPRQSMIFKQEDFNEMIKPSCDNDQIILWSSLFTEFINSRESQQISKKLIGKVKCDLINQKLTCLSIDRNLLSYFTNLTKLSLARNYFNTFPIEIILLSNLTHLNLSDNRIKSIPSSLLKLIGSKLKLQEFDLSHNLLESLHKSIYTISTLKKLVLDYNKLIIIPESISKMKQLKCLSVQSNKLSSFPQALSLMIGLEELYVQNNQIRELPLGFFKLASLKTLDLRNNQIAKFKSHKLDDKQIFLMNEITHFRMGPNPLVKLSNLMFEMKSLVHLELTGCSLSLIPNRLYDLVNLEALYLNQNKLSEVPIDFKRLYKLSVLDLSDNQFTTVPSNAILPSLKKLYLHNNQLYNISFNEFNLPLLSELRLDGNKLTYVSPSIGTKLLSLTLLNLDRNPQITTLPHTLAQLKKLKSLIINSNIMDSPFKELENTDAIMRYLTLQMQQSHFHPRNKLVLVCSDILNQQSKIDFIKNLTSTITNPKDNKKELKKQLQQSKNIGYTKKQLQQLQLQQQQQHHSQMLFQQNSHQPIKWEIDYELNPNTSLYNIASGINSTNSFISSPIMISTSNSNQTTDMSATVVPKESKEDYIMSHFNNQEISKKKNLTIYIRDIIPSNINSSTSTVLNCSQHLFTKRSVYCIVWVLTESEEPVRIYKWLESIKDRCSLANIFIVGIYNSDYSQEVPKDYYNFITPRIEQKCHTLFPNFTFSFINILNPSNNSKDTNSSNSGNGSGSNSGNNNSDNGNNSDNNGDTSGSISKLREEIKSVFLNQKPFGTKVSSSQRLFEKHIKTLQSPFISKKELFSIGEMCKLDKIETKNTCELLTELGLLFWSDDYDWVILDPIWLSNTLNLLLTLKQSNSSNSPTPTTNPSLPTTTTTPSTTSPMVTVPNTSSINLDDSFNKDQLLAANKIVNNNGGVKKKDIILMSNLESIWNDIPTRLYPFLLTLSKKFNIAYQIDTLYDPTSWGYIYPNPYASQQQQQQQQQHQQSSSSPPQSSINLNRLSISSGSPSLRSFSIRNTTTSNNNNNNNNGSGSNNSSPMKLSNLALSPIRKEPSNSNLGNLLLSPLKNLQLQQKIDNLKTLNEKVIFLPNELPDKPPIPIEKMFSSDEARTVGRVFQFEQKIPSSFFPRLLSQLYMFCSIKYCWKTGVVLENCYLSFPVARRFPMSPNMKSFRRSSTISVMGSDDLVYIKLNYNENKIEISSSKMCRHILQIFDSILESYPMNSLLYKISIPCIHCIETSSKPEYLFSLESIEQSVIKGKTYQSCPIHSLIPIKLNQLAPDLTMNDLRHKLIDFKEVELDPTPIGEGGTATVFKGKWRNVDVAIKLLKTDVVGSDFSKVFAEYRREIFCLSSFIHDNILDLKGFCLEPLAIITEFQSGGNLYDYIHDLSNPLDWPLRIKIAKGIAASLQTLHDSRPSVVHRDLKSPNILLSSKDPSTMECHLCDFSLSGFSTTVANRSVQNPVWLAPEVINNELCSDKSDVYAYGVILFELLSRTKFFTHITFMSEVESLITEGVRPSLPSHNIPEYDNLLNICWAQDPTCRPSFIEISKRLDEIDHIIQTRTPTNPQYTESNRNQHILLNRTNTLYTLIKRPQQQRPNSPLQKQHSPQLQKPLPKTPPQIKNELLNNNTTTNPSPSQLITTTTTTITTTTTNDDSSDSSSEDS